MSSVAAHTHDADRDPTEASARVAELFERHGRMVYGICRAMLRDVQDAEDATQQSFLSAHRALLTGARVRDSGAWLATIARNECRGRIAVGMRAPLPVADDDLARLPHGVDEAERRLQAGALRTALDELPERQREAVVLRYVYGLRYREVAKALGLSRPATEALLFRARRTMRVRLRHVAGAALAVPLSVREELALALPGFDAPAGSGGAAAGVAGGLLAKLASAPTAAKIATATVAVSTVGAVGTVESDRPAGDARRETRVVPERPKAMSVPTLPRDSVQVGADRDGAGDEKVGGTSRHGNDDAEGAPRQVGGESRSDDARADADPRGGIVGTRDSPGTASGQEREDDGDGSSTPSSGPGSAESAQPFDTPGSSVSGPEADDAGGGSGESGSSGPSGSSGSGSPASGGSEDEGSSSSGSSGSGEEEHEES